MAEYYRIILKSICSGTTKLRVGGITFVMQPNDENIVKAMDTDGAGVLMKMIEEINVMNVEPLPNPNTGGLIEIYFETESEIYKIAYDGRLVLSQRGGEYAYVFDGELIRDVFAGIRNHGTNLLSGDENNPPLGWGYETEGPEGETNPQPGDAPDIGETQWIIPQDVDIRGTLFNNKEKVSVNSLLFEDLRMLLKEENFDKDRIEHADMFLGDPFYPVDTVEFVRNDTGKKYVINIFENGFSLSGSAFTDEEKDAIYFAYDDTWDKFKNKIRKEFDDATEYNAYWLGLIHEKNVSEIIVNYKDLSDGIVPEYEERFSLIIDYLRGFEVNAPGERFNGKTITEPSSGNYVIMSIKFNTGTEYTVLVTETELMIVSSDMSYGLKYTLPEGSMGYDEFTDFAYGGPINAVTG